MNENVSRRAAFRLAALTAVLAVAVAVPVSVWANHQFNDVPTTHPFHDAISAVADAGITTGFPDGGFHPSAAVTRQAMAAFLERGLSRIGTNNWSASISLAPDALTPLTGVFLDAGATGEGTGFVQLIGTVQIAAITPSQCPCLVGVYIVDLDSGSVIGETALDVHSGVNEGGYSQATATVQAVVPATADSTRNFGLSARLYDSATSVVASRGTLTALYVPLASDGDDTLLYCSPEEGEPNGTIGQAEPYTSPEMFGCIVPALDADYFSVVVPGGGHTLTAGTTGLGGPGTCDMDTLVRVLASDGGQVAVDDDSGPNRCSLVTAGPLVGGTYYVEVKSFSGASTGSYRLTTTLGALPDVPREPTDKD